MIDSNIGISGFNSIAQKQYLKDKGAALGIHAEKPAELSQYASSRTSPGQAKSEASHSP